MPGKGIEGGKQQMGKRNLEETEAVEQLVGLRVIPGPLRTEPHVPAEANRRWWRRQGDALIARHRHVALEKLARILLDPDLMPSDGLLDQCGSLIAGPDGEERLLRAMLRADLHRQASLFASGLA